MHQKLKEYLDGLKDEVKQYFSEYDMRVIYFRKGYVAPPKDVQVSKEQRKEVLTCLNNGFGTASDLVNFDPPLSEQQLSLLLRSWKYKNSPPKGVVVAFRNTMRGPAWRVGWSMCHDGDEWNRYVGIKRAIKKAVEIPDCDLDEVPHSVRPHLKRMLSRID